MRGNYFQAMEIPLLAGRAFTDRDDARAPRVAIVSESLVRAYFPNSNPIGQRIGFDEETPGGVEIVGVIFEDNQYNPAKPNDLVIWGGKDGFTVPFPLVLDPGFKIGVYFDSDATPMNMLIDATTMQIIRVDMGFDSRTPDKYWQFIDTLL